MNSPEKVLVHDFLRESACSFPEKTAVIHETRRATYNQIIEKSHRLADYLVSLGSKKGDRIILMHENSIEYIECYYGILMAGCVVVSLNPDTQPNGLVPLLDDLEPFGLIISSRVLKTINAINTFPAYLKVLIITQADVLPGSSSLTMSLYAKIPAASEAFRNVTIAESDLAAIIYTSGSTGKPKGVMLTHKNIVANTRSICSYLDLTRQDIQMVVLPFFYVMGKSLLNTHFAVGATVVINNKFAFPASVVRQMISEKVTGFSGVPSTFAYLLHRSPLAASRDLLTSLRYVSQAGGHMAKQIKLGLRKTLPDQTKIFIMYGATEASARLTYLEPERFEDKIDSIGKAIPGVTIDIFSQDGKKLRHNEVGEIVASGDNIMAGYWRDEAATRRVIDHNGYHTGDFGYMDNEGYIFVTGRRDNQLKIGGHRVDPQEIEDAIMESQLLIEISVIGVPDELLGHKLQALCVPVDKSTREADILAFASKTLPRHKIPASVAFAPFLPKNANGKVDRSACEKSLNELLIKEI